MFVGGERRGTVREEKACPKFIGGSEAVICGFKVFAGGLQRRRNNLYSLL